MRITRALSEAGVFVVNPVSQYWGSMVYWLSVWEVQVRILALSLFLKGSIWTGPI